MGNHHGMVEMNGMYYLTEQGKGHQSGERFGRMFDLPALHTKATELKKLGAKKGPMDGGGTPSTTETVSAGDVFFGQFIDHDVTLDVESSLSAVAHPYEIPNLRTPALDLDNVYGDGPDAQSYLYHTSGAFAGVKLLTGADGTAINQDPFLAENDLSRSSGGAAIIGDPRNDENRVISQLQLTMIRFHNHVVDAVVGSPGNTLSGRALFEHVRELVTWHYQWVVIYDFLIKMCGGPVVDDILGNGRKYYCAAYDAPYIPVEFSVAAYRFGHSMVPQTIQTQAGLKPFEIFSKTLGNGFTPLEYKEAIIDWNELVQTPNNRVDSMGRPIFQKAEKLDTQLASDLFELPFIPVTDFQSLATRNLLRGQTYCLPSGENVSRSMGIDEKKIEMVHDSARKIAESYKIDISTGTPLWFYILVEAEQIGRETEPGSYDTGEGLGPAGAGIVAETLIGIIQSDSRSFLAKNKNWTPEQGVGVSTLGEMLTYTP